jgi:tRNA 5-methylaminomethyl-2-thiouridine biosynthesis bifunctional protein
VILASGMGARRLAPDLPLQPVRGQASWVAGMGAPAAAWGGYVLPTREGLLFGATHDRDDETLEVREADHARNLATLAAAFPELAAQASGAPSPLPADLAPLVGAERFKKLRRSSPRSSGV